tara:strand:+ start:2272 stop:2613 length:342 start_codon:yes stop_codon:yes gene_type:complete
MFEYNATVLKIIDGDTIDVMVDLGMGVHRKERLRFSRINAWELRGEFKLKGQLAKSRVAELIPVGEKIIVKTEKDKRGKYGRYIAEIYMIHGKAQQNLNDLLLNEGHAVLYNK